MKLYQINNCNAPIMNDFSYQEAENATDAVFKKFGVKTKRSSDLCVDFLVISGEKNENGYFYKRGNQLGLIIDNRKEAI